jgi:hypothetical protein
MLTFNQYLNEAKAPRWKKAGPNGEIETTIGGEKWKIEKMLDPYDRPTGEYHIFAWDKKSKKWDWAQTLYGKTYAKAWVADWVSESIREQKTRSASKIKPEITYVFFTYKKGSVMVDKISRFRKDSDIETENGVSKTVYDYSVTSFDANNTNGKWEIESRWHHTTYNKIFDTEKQFEDFKKKLIKKGEDVTKDFK